MVTERERERERERELFESRVPTPFLFVGLDKERSLQKQGGYTKELLLCILDGAARIKKREDQLRRTTRDLQTRVVKCTEVDGGIFERLL